MSDPNPLPPRRPDQRSDEAGGNTESVAEVVSLETRPDGKRVPAFGRKTNPDARRETGRRVARTAKRRLFAAFENARVRRNAALGAIAVVLLYGAVSHYLTYREAARALAERQNFVPMLRVVKPEVSGGDLKLELPGATEPIETAPLYARATGYIAARYVDIGSRVKMGQVLATIEAPELDQQLAQARSQLAQAQAGLNQTRAALDQARANYELADLSNRRYAKLITQGWVTQQEADNRRLAFAARAADLESAKASVSVAESNLAAQRSAMERLEQLTRYKKIVAPFDGVVTVRNAEVGNLITADNAQGRPLFTVSRMDKLRVRIDIPQSAALGIADGLTARILFPEQPGKEYIGTLARTSEAFAAGSRTLLSEVDLDNPDGALRAGTYVRVSIDVPRTKPAVTVPSAALIFDEKGLRVAAVVDGRVQMKAVEIARDFGTRVELLGGLDGDEILVINPYTAIADGQKVTFDPASLTPPPATGPPAAAH